MKIVPAVAGSLGCMVLLGCADASPVSVNSPAIVPQGLASFQITSQEALSISGTYLDRDPLGPFSVGYVEFFENPELVTDEQFLAHADPAIPDSELSQTEYDAAVVEDYAESCTDGRETDGGTQYIMSLGRCESMYSRCVSRVRRIPEKRARALGYAACMGAYAICRADEEAEAGDMQ